MPSLESRLTDISNTHVRARGEMPSAPAPGAPAMPTPQPPYLGRHPRMVSSLPVIFSTPDAALRQFYGRNSIPTGRVAS